MTRCIWVSAFVELFGPWQSLRGSIQLIQGRVCPLDKGKPLGWLLNIQPKSFSGWGWSSLGNFIKTGRWWCQRLSKCLVNPKFVHGLLEKKVWPFGFCLFLLLCLHYPFVPGTEEPRTLLYPHNPHQSFCKVFHRALKIRNDWRNFK